MNQVYEFINNKILLNQNVFILCDTGLNNSLFVGMYFLMKYYNLNYHTVYHNIASSNKINSYEHYLSLTLFEPYIFKLPISNNMDLS